MIKYLVLFSLLFLIGCTPSMYMQGKASAEQGQYDTAIDKYYSAIKENPNDYKAWRELGVAYFKKGDMIKAEDALKQANNIKPDARANLYLGLILEKKELYDDAIATYTAALNLSGEKKTKNLIRGHLDRLIKTKLQNDVAFVVQNEENIKTDTISPNSIAVVNFNASGLSDDLAPIALGLAEFTSVDLSKIEGLNVVDRLKIDLIQKELNLSKLQFADPSTGPRVGKLLGSRRIITGTVIGDDEDNIRLDGAIVNVANSNIELTEATEGNIDKFFDIQKAFVFKVIDSLGITLTKEERDAISEVPTESFVAFMAYCRGLNYQQLGNDAAAGESFNEALKYDVNFNAAQNKSEQFMASTTAKGTDGFEADIDAEVPSDDTEGSLDGIQTTNLNLLGFIDPNYNRSGQSPDRPPEDNPENVTVIIKGDFDGSN